MNKILGNRYEILEKLGQGGMGEVFKGRDTQTDVFVAIKNLRGSISDDEAVIERFRREAQALRDLNHPNIVKMLDMLQQDDEYFLITEYIEGGDLAQTMQEKGKFTVEETLRIGLELADALSRTHHLGIIHRDIKPANVLLAADGTPRLTDFGVAHMESQERLTGTGMAIGTMDYMPPEAINGEAVDARADVWSFGIMLYEMLTGKHPFEGETRMNVLTNILQSPTPDLLDEYPDAPEDLGELLQQMLDKDRNARIRSARQVGAAIEAILEGDERGLRRLQTPPKAASPQSPVPSVETSVLQESEPTAQIHAPPQNQHYVRVIVGIVIVVILIAGGGFALSVNFDPEQTATPNPTPTPEPTATLEAIVGDAPEGYQWNNLDELYFAMPDNWVRVPNSILTTIFGDAAEHEWTNAVFTALEQKRIYAFYIDWTVLTAVLVTIEDTPIILPDEALVRRMETLASAGDSMPIEVAESIELPIGNAFFVRDDRMPAGEDDEIDRFDNYNFYAGTTLYSVSFISTKRQLEDAQEQINRVLASIQIGEFAPTPEPSPESTATATAETTADIEPVVIANMPEGWKVAQGEYTAYAVPQDMIVTSGANRSLLEASLGLVMGNLDQADDIGTLFDQMLVDVMTGKFQTTELFFSSSMYQPNVLTTNLETANAIVQGLFMTVAENEGISIEFGEGEQVMLPVGEALKSEMQLTVGDRPPFRTVYYIVLKDDGLRLYALAFSFLDSESERYRILANDIAQTFIILK